MDYSRSTLQKDIPRQLPRDYNEEDLKASAEAGKTATNFVILGQFALKLFI